MAEPKAILATNLTGARIHVPGIGALEANDDGRAAVITPELAATEPIKELAAALAISLEPAPAGTKADFDVPPQPAATPDDTTKEV